MSRTVTAAPSLPEEDLVVLEFTKPDGTVDKFPVPKLVALEADLIDLMRTANVAIFMSAVLTRHAPDLAARLRLTQMGDTYEAYMGEDEATPGESPAS